MHASETCAHVLPTNGFCVALVFRLGRSGADVSRHLGVKKMDLQPCQWSNRATRVVLTEHWARALLLTIATPLEPLHPPSPALGLEDVEMEAEVEVAWSLEWRVQLFRQLGSDATNSLSQTWLQSKSRSVTRFVL